MKDKFCLDLTLKDLTLWCEERGVPKYRASQIYGWLSSGAVTTDEMTNVPKNVRSMLEEDFIFGGFILKDHLVSKLDGTEKFVFALYDGNIIETVAMRYKTGISVCISSQAGCKMGCAFCASALGGFVRDLTAGEMMGQVLAAQRSTGEEIGHIVIMGMGEPLDNYDNVLRFIRLITHEKGQNISQRNITLSTCGIVPGIRRLAEEGIPLTLALSLHAPNDRVREGLMPIAKVYKLDEILDACHYYFEKTGRRVTFEYSLVRGVNDNTAEAAELAALIGRQHGHVNLIPVNPIRERDFVQPDRRAVEAFRSYLENKGIAVTVRREMGRDINGACGQLRKSYMDHDATAERNV